MTNKTEAKPEVKETKAQMKLLASIRKDIQWIGVTGAAFEARVQATVKRVLAYMSEYHDKRPMLELLDTMTKNIKGYVVNEVVQYIKKNSPLEILYSDDKKTVVDVKEEFDDKGNLVKAYSPPDVLDKSPFHEEEAVTKRTQNEIQPWSIKMYLDRLSSMRDQIRKAGEPGNRGILGTRNGATVALHKGDEGYEAAAASLLNLVEIHGKDFDNVLALVKAGTPPAAIPNLPSERTTTAATPLTSQHAAANAAGDANGAGKTTLIPKKATGSAKKAA